MLKAVIFDMDGVIIDSEPIYHELTNDYLSTMKIVICDEEYDSYVGTTSNIFWSSIKQKFNIPHTLDELMEMNRVTYVEYLNAHGNELKPIDGVVSLIDDLKKNNVKLAIASSSAIDAINTVVTLFKINASFDALITGEGLEKSKPEPDIFLHAAKKLGIAPYECLVIEDSHNGTIAAKKAGMKCLGYQNPNSGSQDLSCADMIISSYSEVDYKKLCSLFTPS